MLICPTPDPGLACTYYSAFSVGRVTGFARFVPYGLLSRKQKGTKSEISANIPQPSSSTEWSMCRFQFSGQKWKPRDVGKTRENDGVRVHLRLADRVQSLGVASLEDGGRPHTCRHKAYCSP